MFAYVKFKNKKVMTKFIDRTEKCNNPKKTTFKKYLSSGFEVVDVDCIFHSTENYDIIEYLGTDNSYGDVFKAYHDENDENNFTLFFGVKGDEFNNE